MIVTKERHLDIKELAHGEPNVVTPFRFDLGGEIKERHWDVIEKVTRSNVEQLRVSGGPQNVNSMFLRSVGIVAPGMIRPLIDETVVSQIESAWEWNRKRGNIVAVLEDYSALRVLAPDVPDKSMREKENIPWLKEWIKTYNTPSYTSLHALNCLKIIAPETFGNFRVPRETIQDAKWHIQTTVQELNWSEASRSLSNLKLAAPDRLKEMEVDEHTWSVIFDDVKEEILSGLTIPIMHPNVVIIAVNQLAELAILQAKRIEISNKGVRLVMEEPNLTGNNNPIPERRRF